MVSSYSQVQSRGFSGQIALGILVLLSITFTGAFLSVVQSVMVEPQSPTADLSYVQPARVWLLQGVIPLATVAMAVMFLAPGLYLSASLGWARTPGTWLLKSFVLSMAVLVPLVAIVQLGSGVQPRGFGFLVLVACTAAVSAAIFYHAQSRSQAPLIDLGPSDIRDLGFALLAGYLVLAVFSAKFYWENLSGDGGGGIQWARLFINRLWPFWPPEAGTIQKAPGITSFLFVLPSSWFMRLIGEVEFAVRAPYVLHTLVLYPVMMDLIRLGSEDEPGNPRDSLGVSAHLLVIGSLLLFTLAVIYSGGYHPYFGDSPMPAVREQMTMALFLGILLFFFRNEQAWVVVTGVLSYMTLPSGGLWMVFWGAAVVLVWFPWPMRRLIWLAGTMVLCAAIGAILPMLFGLAGLPYGGQEFNSGSIADRLRYIAVGDVSRFAFWAVPVGILPVIALLAWPLQDRVSKTLTLLSLAYFFFFYFQGYRVLLHHFIPCMLPPIIVFWRILSTRDTATKRLAEAGMLAGLVVSTWLAWPAEMKMHRFDRHIGAHMLAEGPVFETYDEAALDVTHTLFGELFPIGWEDGDAAERFFGPPLVWYFYSLAPKAEGQVINYVIRPLDSPPPSGTLFSSHLDYGVWIMDQDLYQRHADTQLPIDTGAPIFVVPPSEMYGRGDRTEPYRVWDLAPMIKRMLGMS